MNLGRLFWKSFLAFWGALLLAGLAVGMMMSLLNEARTRDLQLAAGPRTAFIVNTAAATLRHGGVPALRELMREWQQERPDDVSLYAVDAQGRDLLGRALPARVLMRARARVQAPVHDGHPPNVREVMSADGQRYLLFIPAEALAAHLRARPQPLPWVPIIIGLFASLVFSALLAWYLAKPIGLLRWAFAALAEGRLDTRVQPLMGRRRDEVADLGADFDRMAQQLGRLIDAQRRLLHDVSHELRSPLARLQAAVGLLPQDLGSHALIERIERESVRLDELVGELLTLSHLEAGTDPRAREAVDLLDLVAAIAEDARFEAQAQQRDVRFSGSGEIRVMAHVGSLYRALENVIRNAVKYTAEGSVVEVEVDYLAPTQQARIVICDRGPGVPEADRSAIFEPFYRSANGQRAAGFGLGLAIARRAVEANGGHIRARNRSDGGLCMEILLSCETV
jgi:two-component system OmpR family sensor kinase